MRVRTLVIGIVILLISCSAATAQFHTLHLAWWTSYGNVGVKVDGTDYTFAVGSFRGWLDGVELDHPLYCTDIYHSFYFSQTWEVERFLVPPNPPPPPPYNTWDAAWLYHAYAPGATTGVKTAGLQLALWEITHDPNWRADFSLHHWWEYGAFQLRNPAVLVRLEADAYLTALYNVGEYPPLTNYGYYYRPRDASPGQGQFGEGPLVPEPATVLLLGMGILGSAVGLGLRRRR